MKPLVARATLASALLLLPAGGGAGAADVRTGWNAVPAILARIKPPTFPARDCLITDHGAMARAEADNTDGRLATPSEDIVIRGCTMKDGHGGVVMGSEVSGGVRNVFVERCRMDSPHLDRALRFKSNARRGGVVENVYMRDVEIGRVAEAVVTVDFLYETGADGPHRPVVRNVVLERVTSRASPRLLWVRGFEGAIIDGLRFFDSVFRGLEGGEVLEHAGLVELRNVTLEPAAKTKSLNSRSATP